MGRGKDLQDDPERYGRKDFSCSASLKTAEVLYGTKSLHRQRYYCQRLRKSGLVAQSSLEVFPNGQAWKWAVPGMQTA